MSLKTLIERLEYGRQVLSKFWLQEIEYVRRAMGFRLPAEIHFDSIVLSDESAQKKLLLDLADRDIISQETLLEREERERTNDSATPKKAGPYHNPQHAEDMAKIGVTKDIVDTEEYFDRLGLPHKEQEEIVEQKEEKMPVQEKEQKPVDEGGRPKFSKDINPRKQKRVLPRSGDPTAATIWGISAQDKISEIMTPIACAHFKKKDARALSKSEVDQLEYLKLCIFTGMEPFIEITPELVEAIVKNNTKPSKAFDFSVASKISSFASLNKKKPNVSDYRHIYASTYAEMFSFG